MKLKLSLKWLLTATLMLLGLNCVIAQAQTTGTTTKVTVEVANIVDVKGDGQVDWSKGEIRAIGMGVAPAFATTPAQIKVYAREAAVVAAERNLLKAVKGVQITSETTVENLMLKIDTINTKVNGLLKGAVVVSERQMTDNSYEVTMAVQMYGQKDSLANSINLVDQFKAANPDDKKIEPTTPVNPDPNPDTKYTGLIIDCRGMGLYRSQCPRILDQNNSNIWSNLNVSSAIVNEKGIAGYYLSENDPKLVERVGKNPLKIVALRASGSKMFKTDAVLSPANAQLVRTENAKTMFLEKLNVAFLTDK